MAYQQQNQKRAHRRDSKRNSDIHQLPSTSHSNHNNVCIHKDSKTSFVLKRASTPSFEKCFHCEHDHKKSCCLYIYDTPEDLGRYANWKEALDQGRYSRYSSGNGDIIVGNTSPQLENYPGKFDCFWNFLKVLCCWS